MLISPSKEFGILILDGDKVKINKLQQYYNSLKCLKKASFYILHWLEWYEMKFVLK